MISVKVKDKIGKAAFAAAATICTIAVAVVFVFLIIKSVPSLNKIGFFNFLFGDKWMPDREATFDKPLSGAYGIFKMIVGTFAATIGALIFGGLTGYFTAVFLAFYCPKKLKKPLFSLVNLLAGIPSVVYGFFGITFLLPALAFIAPNNGSGLLATSIILGIMILPTVVSLSKTSLEAVPESYYENSLALGATKDKTVFRIISPAARSGITASLILGIGRALGETMAVVMVAGNSVAYPNGLFSSFRVLTANIVLEMGYAGEVQEGALIATGVVLLLFVLLVNVALNFAGSRAVKKLSGKTKPENMFSLVSSRVKKAFGDGLGVISDKIRACVIGKCLSIAAGIMSVGALLLVLGFIFVNGLPALIKQPSIIYGAFEFGGDEVTVLPAIITTLLSVVLSLLISLPIGVMTAIFLNEYAKKTNFFVKAVRSAIDVLSGVPSIVYGLFGMVTFVPLFGGGTSVLAGVLTISIMLLPVIVRSVEESLKSVSDSLREGSLALGAGKLRTIFKVVLPSALPGITSAIILSMGRVISESAPFIYTMGSVICAAPKSLFDGGATLAVALYQLSGEGWHVNEAYATAVILIVIVLALNLTAELITSKIKKKAGGAKNK